MYFIPPF